MKIRFNRYNGRILRFLVSGGSAALIEFASFSLMLSVFGILLISNTLSFALGFLVSFMLNRRWVFNSRTDVRPQLAKYFLLASVNLVISNFLIAGLTYYNVHPLIAKIGVMVAVATWNYMIFSSYIFKNHAATKN